MHSWTCSKATISRPRPTPGYECGDASAYQAFLETLCAEEISHRAGTRLSRLAKKAGFPFLKTVDDFDFTLQSELRLATLGSYLGPEFVTGGRNLILIGKPGRGKTHLAIAIAYKAIQNGFDARFTTCAALIDDLSRASHKTTFRKALASYVHPHVLVVDELGYLACTPDAANVLYHVVNERHLKRRPMIFTTNKPLRTWGEILHDQDLGDVIVDRLLERARVLKLDGPSVRSRHVPQTDLEDTPSTPDRVSGKDRPEFPEPTLFDDEHSSDEDRFISIGPIRRGLVLVVWTERLDDEIRIISARWATAREASMYRAHVRSDK